MLTELAAGTIFLGAVLADWALDRLLRSVQLHRCFAEFMVKRVRDRKKPEVL